jgi:membrane protein involved in colicin uptake
MTYKQEEHIENEERDKKVLLFSIGLHVIILLLLFLPIFSGLANPRTEPLQGVVVDLSYYNEGQGERVTENNNSKPAEKLPAAKPEPAKKVVEKPATKVVTAVPVVSKTVVKDEVDVLAAEKAKKEAEAKRIAEVEAKKKADAEAKKKAEEARKEAEYNKSKSKFSDLFKSGSSKGNSDNPDKNAGSVTGEPDATALDKISTGKGKAGNGLGGRGIVYEPKITDNSQKTGRVVIRVCVDQTGEVTTAKFTQKGSTTTDSYLVNLALKNSKKYRFTKSDAAEQCGDISIDFKLK